MVISSATQLKPLTLTLVVCRCDVMTKITRYLRILNYASHSDTGI